MPHIQQGLVRKSKSISTRTELEKRSKNYRNNHVALESSQIQFQTKTDENSAYSAPFWSKTSRLQVIPDGRRELIKMVQSMPESSFELSLKDIVEDRTNVQEEQQEVAKKIEQKNRKFRRSQMLRSQSVDSGVFLLKLFLPACPSSRKRSMIGKSSKVSQSPLFDGSETVVDKEWWSVRFLVSGKSKNSCSSSRYVS